MKALVMSIMIVVAGCASQEAYTQVREYPTPTYPTLVRIIGQDVTPIQTPAPVPQTTIPQRPAGRNLVVVQQSTVFSPANEIYISSGYLRRPYMMEALDILERSGYTISTNRKAPLKLNLSFTSVRKGGNVSLSGRYGFRTGAQGSDYTCIAYLKDQDGRIISRGEGNALYWGNVQFPIPTGNSHRFRTNAVRLSGSRDQARAKAASEAIRTLIQNY